MISLKLNNSLSCCTTFDEQLDIKWIAKMSGVNEVTKVMIRENLDAIEPNSGNDELRKALEKIMSKPVWPRKIKK